MLSQISHLSPVAHSCNSQRPPQGGGFPDRYRTHARDRARRPAPKDGVMIDSNENPLGPSHAARDAISAILPLGGRDLPIAPTTWSTLSRDRKASIPTICASFPGPPLRLVSRSPLSLHRKEATSPPIPALKPARIAATATEARAVKVPLTNITRTTSKP